MSPSLQDIPLEMVENKNLEFINRAESGKSKFDSVFMRKSNDCFS